MKVLITAPKAVHDGFGGKHPPGSTPDLDDEVASILIDRGQAQSMDGVDKELAKSVAGKAKRKSTKARSKSRMTTFDDLPADVRELAREHGNEVVEMHLSGMTADEILEELTK